jgi:hypothetical protein
VWSTTRSGKGHRRTGRRRSPAGKAPMTRTTARMVLGRTELQAIRVEAGAGAETRVAWTRSRLGLRPTPTAMRAGYRASQKSPRRRFWGSSRCCAHARAGARADRGSRTRASSGSSARMSPDRPGCSPRWLRAPDTPSQARPRALNPAQSSRTGRCGTGLRRPSAHPPGARAPAPRVTRHRGEAV